MLQIKFNDEIIFEPESWEESSEVIESVNQTEAGTDQIAVTRYDKLSISCFLFHALSSVRADGRRNLKSIVNKTRLP